MSVVKVKARTYRISPVPPDRSEVVGKNSDGSYTSDSPLKHLNSHSKHLSMLSRSPQLRYHSDIQTLTETLISMKRSKTREMRSTVREELTEVPDEVHERVTKRLREGLREEVELIHSEVYAEAVKAEIEAAKARTETEGGLALPLLSSSPVPFDKQVPSSIYSSYKNLTSFDRLTTKQELLSLISRTAQLLFHRDLARAQRVEKEWTQSYERCLQTEAKLCNAVWSECLAAIAAAAGRKAPGAGNSVGDSDLISVQKELEELLSDYLSSVSAPKSQAAILQSVSKLSQQFRILLKKLSGDHLLQVCELFWKCAVLLYDSLERSCTAQIAQQQADLKQEIGLEEARIHSQMRILTHQCEAQLLESKQENDQLKAQLSRLKGDIAHWMEIVRDRDEELHQLRDSGVFAQLERMLAEFVANAGEDPGEPELPKSMYGSSPVKGVRTTPTRFGGNKPEPVVVEKKEEPVQEEPPPPPVPKEEKEPSEVASESDDSVSSETLKRVRTANRRDSIRDSNSSYIRPTLTIQNIILYQLSRHPHSGHVMKPKEVYKLLENLMDAKFKLDIFDESQGAAPRSLAEFTLDFLYLINEKKSLTLKHTSSLIKSIEKLRSEGDQYADFYHKLLELSEPGTCPHDLCVFLVKVRMAFQIAMQRTHAKPAKADISVGGKLSFAETADMILSVFAEDREVGEAVLEKVQLQDVDSTEKAKLIFCGRLAKIGRDLKYFYVQADSQKTGSVEFPVFVRTCRIALEMNLSLANAQSLWSSLTDDDELTYVQLTTLDFKSLSTKANNKALAVSKLTFMSCIMDQYWEMRREDLDRLQHVFLQHDTNGDGVLTLKEFGGLIDSLEPGVPPSVTVQMFREALEIDDNVTNPDAMSPQSFCQVVFRHQLGGFGKNVFQSKLAQLFTQRDDLNASGPDKPKKKKGKKK